MDMFEKCYQFSRANEVIAAGLLPYFRTIEENHGPVVKMEGKDVVMAGSNDYLGLTQHPEVIEAAIQAIRAFGSSCSGSRFLNGTSILHTQLEEELADFLGVEACLAFTTGFLTNQGVIATLVERGEHLLSDAENHASIVAGGWIVRARGGNVHRYATNNMSALENTLKKIPKDAPKLIVTDGVFSMSGRIVDLPALVRLAKAYGARVMIDEAHAAGVLGEGGRGTPSHFGLKNTDVDLTMGTFSKSFASLGGFIAGERRVVDYIKFNSQAFRFSASMAPGSVGAARASLRIIRREPERIERLRKISLEMRQGLKSQGFKLIESITPILPVIIGDDMLTFRFWKRLMDEGVFANAVIAPGVPSGMQLIRLSLIATYKQEHLDKILEAFRKVGKEFGLIG
ncbi:MAG: pyridoxal phosphate-dependent aminotransferase family protein [Candidatus Aminicenantes bacterium]|nr:pyridoxal phosphate-dependent aminotransferase family protein [Candidatus Aminicenantes bacterium]